MDSSTGAGADFSRRLLELEAAVHELRSRRVLLKDLLKRLGMVPERVQLIAQISQDLAVLDLDRVGGVATRKMPELIGARYGSLFLYEEEAGELVLKAHNHPVRIDRRISVRQHPNTVMAVALSRRRPLLVPDLAEFEREERLALDRAYASKYQVGSCLILPLRVEQRTLGLLNLAEWGKDAPFDPAEDLPVIEQISYLLAMSIRNCQLFQELRNQAHTDALTRLADYRTFQETLRSEIRRSTRYGRPLSLVLLDVDRFREISDRFGQAAGDYALVELANVIRMAIRREDLPARHGGDEIAIVLPETPFQDCPIAMERILKEVQSHAFLFEGKPIPVSVSLGGATYRPGMTLTELVNAADEALYRAKEAGGNRYAIAESPPEAGPAPAP